MTEDNDNSRNEVWISRKKVDVTTNLAYDVSEVSLKSKNEGIDDLIRKAKEAIEKP